MVIQTNNLPNKICQRWQLLLPLLEEGESLNVATVAGVLGISRPTVYSTIKQMREYGLPLPRVHYRETPPFGYCQDCGDELAVAILNGEATLWCPGCAWDEVVDGPQRVKEKPKHKTPEEHLTTDTFVTVQQAAHMLDVDRSTIKVWIKKGKLPAVTSKTRRGKYYPYEIPLSAVRELANE